MNQIKCAKQYASANFYIFDFLNFNLVENFLQQVFLQTGYKNWKFKEKSCLVPFRSLQIFIQKLKSGI